MAVKSKALGAAKKVALIGLCAVLYGIFGYDPFFTYICPRALILGVVVIFWPAAVFPAIFGVLFGPLVGGVSAAIGIFLSDMLLFQWNLTRYNNVALGIAIGVVANFVCFYLISYISRKNLSWTRIRLGSIGLIVSGLIVVYVAYLDTLFPISIPPPYSSFGAICIGLFLLIVVLGGHVWPEWRSYGIASVISKAIGGTIIGLGLWGISQFFVLPLGYYQLPFDISLAWLAWTFSSESLFLLTIVPLVLKACYKAFPTLKPPQSREK